MLVVVGGETASWTDDKQSLTMKVHIAQFTASFATWAMILTADKEGRSCSSSEGDGVLCPQPRRDASVKMMSNDASGNGRLLMFGGLGAITAQGSTGSVGRAYLEGSSTSDAVVALSDLWYLDMTPLTLDCVLGEEACEALQWTLVDVSAPLTPGRWGAGMVLDPSDNLYIIGGNTYDRTSKTFHVLSDIYIFQLRDAYYKYCSATGAGLISSVAGVNTVFHIQCRDAFGEMSDTASFEVDIIGKEDQPGMKPAPVLIGNGEYDCKYTPFRTGLYEVRIYIGRGGSDNIDQIEGYDPVPSNAVHDYVFRPASRRVEDATTPKTFMLIIEPGDTKAQSSLAVGDYITSSTAGNIGTFLITARDAFGNRRPGGDSVTAIMVLWDQVRGRPYDSLSVPQTGSVIDNMDGSYAVSYRITRAGLYQHSISLVAAVGAGTPIFLRVDSNVADVSRTYVYGSLKRLVTGEPSSIFVQTRDQFGNNIRFTAKEKPCTGYPLTLKTCDQVIEYDLCSADDFVVPCPADKIETNVGKTLAYQVIPIHQVP